MEIRHLTLSYFSFRLGILKAFKTSAFLNSRDKNIQCTLGLLFSRIKEISIRKERSKVKIVNNQIIVVLSEKQKKL